MRPPQMFVRQRRLQRRCSGRGGAVRGALGQGARGPDRDQNRRNAKRICLNDRPPVEQKCPHGPPHRATFKRAPQPYERNSARAARPAQVTPKPLSASPGAGSCALWLAPRAGPKMAEIAEQDFALAPQWAKRSSTAGRAGGRSLVASGGPHACRQPRLLSAVRGHDPISRRARSPHPATTAPPPPLFAGERAQASGSSVGGPARRATTDSNTWRPGNAAAPLYHFSKPSDDVTASLRPLRFGAASARHGYSDSAPSSALAQRPDRGRDGSPYRESWWWGGAGGCGPWFEGARSNERNRNGKPLPVAGYPAVGGWWLDLEGQPPIRERAQPRRASIPHTPPHHAPPHRAPFSGQEAGLGPFKGSRFERAQAAAASGES
jgi:hypothetical protein